MIARFGKVAYRLDFPEELSLNYSTFHVSQLWKFVADGSTVVPMDDVQVDDRLSYIDRSITFLDQKTKALHNKVVSLVKVQWQHRKGFEWTWEPELEIREHCHELFTKANFEDNV